ncbi:DNA helicase/exodeoxyribonuclease V, subunit A [Faunimonas pinastri]|uniref:DNA 3'-5' helicase n=1 Tax=Faunimonas pinastri TaxID=1855383 RepID=A0A1H9GJG3_9HYPH|nr:double-strand break repair helicase AddA [Faunimonas pinastri]SEQ50217.1 DNA helicase/exodeoxyribonuclease V, subunit A [Faunimonas pinastri]
MNEIAPLTRTQQNQWAASDPEASAWVIANAGSGKTHVLTLRVIRLLLSGSDPASILCVTFTKAAAAEMSRRIFDTLGGWATAPAAELAEKMKAVQGRAPTPAEMRRARQLFARALETPGGLKIQTIHAFCERLLHQFPFEANVPAHFEILDDVAADALMAEARHAVLSEALDLSAPLGRAMRFLAETASDKAIHDGLDAVIRKRDALRGWLATVGSGSDGGGESAEGTIGDAMADLRHRLGLRADETEASLHKQICQAAKWLGTHCSTLIEGLDALLSDGGKDNDRSAHVGLQAIAEAGHEQAESAARLAFFLTKKEDGWSPRVANRRFSAAFRKKNTGLDELVEDEIERLLPLAAKLNAAKAVTATEALLTVGDAILQRYGTAKSRAGYLDYDDLIVRTRNLLERSGAAAWVLYKLDARLRHILVDEAQDTSPNQWAIVRALAGDFFAGETAGRRDRTIFAVGDDKQSIYGFQGAAPRMLNEMKEHFRSSASRAEASFVATPLFLSFRSTREVLDAVDGVFHGDLAGRITASDYEMHAAHRHLAPGEVLVWPRCLKPKRETPEDWTTPFDAPTAAESALAQQIAGEIQRLLADPVLRSGKRIRPGEIMILSRKRDAFVAAMNRELKNRRIPTAGADRIPLSRHIAVLDLLALADVMLLPENDLQLAAVLKSPLIGLSEAQLMEVAARRGRMSLWEALQGSEVVACRKGYERLRGWRGMADQVTPFRFFATVLGPDGGRRAFRERLGSEAEDVLDTFVSQTLAYEGTEAPSLQGFTAFLRASERDIKRELDEGSAGVRVMTVHGSKGLEADVVFLVDTGGQIVPTQHRDALVPVGDQVSGEAFLWRRKSAEAPPEQAKADAEAGRDAKDEYARLLYVAMTRARDVLHVCGIAGERTEDDCWHGLIANALVPEDAPRDPETGELEAPYHWPVPPREAVPPAGEAARGEEAEAQVFEWLHRAAPSPLPGPEPLRPSRGLAEPEATGDIAARPSPSPLPSDALIRGRAVHKLLQILPRLPPERWEAATEAFLARDLAERPDLHETLAAEVLEVLRHPDLADIFGPESRAELAIVGEVKAAGETYAVSGQIDRLLATPEILHIVDFKTNRFVPATLEAVDPGYILQLALYRRLLAEIHPGKAIRASLVWTARASLMDIPDHALDAALTRIGVTVAAP